MELRLMRHGATTGNAQRRYVGRRSDEPLSVQGIAQCQRAGADRAVRVVYVSPLLRARQTAAVCFPAARIEVVDDLAEMDFGTFEGRTANEMEHDAGFRAWVDSNCEGACPGGESFAEFARRSNGALAQLLRDAASRKEEQVIVVAHGGTAMAALHEFAAPDERRASPFDWHLGNGESFVASVDLEGSRIVLSDIHMSL